MSTRAIPADNPLPVVALAMPYTEGGMHRCCVEVAERLRRWQCKRAAAPNMWACFHHLRAYQQMTRTVPRPVWINVRRGVER